ncbi:hypothetical protein BGZ72_010583, partial [Mortierella alpina]
LALFTEAAKIEGRILGVTFRGRLMRDTGVPTATRVMLSGGLFQTLVNDDGLFSFPDVPLGAYILEVKSPQLTYSKSLPYPTKVRVVVTASEVRATRMSVSDHFSSYQQTLPMPLTLRPRPRPMHYIPPEGAKVAGWFANPMILLSSFSFLMLLLMPKIMANLDAEALEAMRSSYDFGCLPSLAPPQAMGSLPQHESLHSAHHAYQQHPPMKNALSARDALASGGHMAPERNAVNSGMKSVEGYRQAQPVLTKKQQ